MDATKNKETTAEEEPTSSYLTKELFHSIIAEHLTASPFSITKFNNSDAVLAGNNFLSKIVLNAVQIEEDDGTVRDFSFISKVLGMIVEQKVVEQMQAFPKEIGMYRDIIPEFEKILKDVAEINIKFGAKLFFAELNPNQIIVLENLTESGYKVANRFVGLNETQVLLVLEKISKWHAVSRIYCERHNPLDKMLKSGLINENTIEFMTHAYNELFINLLDALSATDIAEAHLDIIKNWENKIGPNIFKVSIADPNDFNVLNHGDLWSNNMLFLDDESGTPIDVKFIDLQLGNYGSPALDLIYFFVSSVRDDLFAAKYDEFVAHYHKHLTATLKLLKQTTIPTLKDIHIQLIKKSFFSTIMLCGGLVSILTDYQNDGIEFTSPANLSKEEAFAQRKKMIENPRILNNLLGLFKFMGNRGMLDI